jgi:hypothetical protein
VRIPLDTQDFARIAAQTAKQVIVQKIRESERETLLEELKAGIYRHPTVIGRPPINPQAIQRADLFFTAVFQGLIDRTPPLVSQPDMDPPTA